MKKYLAALLCCLLALMAATACAELHIGEHSPEAWADRGDIVRVTQVDTNRSDCLLVEAFGKIMLIDGGYNGYNDHVQDVLNEKGVTRFDWILNTHPHDDHIDGANRLLRSGWTADVFLSPFAKDTNDTHQRGCVKALDRLGIPYEQITSGYQVLVGGEEALPDSLTLEMTMYTTGSRDFNDGSVLMVLKYGESIMLFMADLTRGAQQKLMEQLPAEVFKADIIKAPHHGLTYFDNEFLALADPQLVTIPNKQSTDNQIANQCRRQQIPCLFSGSGDVVMETDGTDWYVWQLPQR